MKQRIEYFYDVLCPYAYLAFRRLPGIAKRINSPIDLCPVSLTQVLAASENTVPANVPKKLAYMKQDVEALGKYYGVPISWPGSLPTNSSQLMSVLSVVQGEDRWRLTQALFEAIWIDGEDLTNPEILAAIVDEERLSLASESAVVEILNANSDLLVKRGAFGVPTCFIGNQMVFGNDRLFMLQVFANQ